MPVSAPARYLTEQTATGFEVLRGRRDRRKSKNNREKRSKSKAERRDYDPILDSTRDLLQRRFQHDLARLRAMMPTTNFSRWWKLTAA